jgi:site-specific recombinase XerD
MTPIAATSDNHFPVSADLVEQAREYAEAAQAQNTRRAYAGDFADFQAFCRDNHLSALPAAPQAVVAYITERARKHKVATIRRRLSGIAQAHRERGLESPTTHEIVSRVLRGIVRTKGAAPARKSAVTLDVLRAMLLCIEGEDVAALRDRAIVLLGFAAALRRSEIAALDVADLRFDERGLLVAIRRSKTDQEAEGQIVAVPFVANRALCAASAVRRYLDAAGITEGPLFQSLTFQRRLTGRRISGQDVANLVRRLADRARVEGDFSGHSLRAGFATSAAHAKVSLEAIARTTRHKSLAVLMSYVRPAQAFDDAALFAIVA